ncbi:DUF3944 domain-containing protein, partial [Salmonella enterica subsp. enterica serovar Montevideo]|nr:DUF3944 domain-containing protein [Salmonella enterica subsp. enterica serovar Montevideo]
MASSGTTSTPQRFTGAEFIVHFLQHCSEEQLADFARLLTHNEKGKARWSSVLSHNELFKAMEG